VGEDGDFQPLGPIRDNISRAVCNTATVTIKRDQITHSKQHKSFFWDNVIERTHCTYNPLDTCERVAL